MKDRAASGVNYGPWLVGLGAALWGTESAWRIPLNELFDADVIVFWEHVLILLMFLPLLLPNLGELRKIDISTWGYLLFSGFAGSAVGTIFFTLALKHGNPTVVNVILNIQPVISTLGAYLLFGDRLKEAVAGRIGRRGAAAPCRGRGCITQGGRSRSRREGQPGAVGPRTREGATPAAESRCR